MPAGGVTPPGGGVVGVAVGGTAGGVVGLPLAVGGFAAGLEAAVGAVAGDVDVCVGVDAAVGGTAAALAPAAPAPGVGEPTVAGEFPASLPPHAERMAATPKHVAIRDLMSASNIGTESKQNASWSIAT